MIQAVLLDKKNFTLAEANKWIKSHNFHPIKKVHVTDNYYRYRLSEPDSKHLYRIKKEDHGIAFIIAVK